MPDPTGPFRVCLIEVCGQLSKYPALNNLEKQTAIPKAYAVIGAVTLYFFLILFNLGGQLLTNIAGFVIPGYYSLNALFTASKADDTQWLTVCAQTSPGKPSQRFTNGLNSTGLSSPSSRKSRIHTLGRLIAS